MATTTSETLAVEGGELPLTVSRGEEVGPAVVIVPSIFGVSPDLVEQMEEIADGGALVVAMDPFFRDQPGPMSYGDPPAAIARMGRIEVEASYRDFRALVEHARPRSNGKVIGVGICFGGPFCFMAAADGALAGVVTWHGSRLDQFLDGAATIRCAVRLHFGDADPVVPMETVEKVKAAFADHPDAVVAVHAGASHGFSHRAAAVHDLAAEKAGMAAVHELVTLLT